MWIPEGPERTTNGLREWASSSRNVNTHMIGKEVSIRGEMEGKTGLGLWTGVGEVGLGEMKSVRVPGTATLTFRVLPLAYAVRTV